MYTYIYVYYEHVKKLILFNSQKNLFILLIRLFTIYKIKLSVKIVKGERGIMLKVCYYFTYFYEIVSRFQTVIFLNKILKYY